MKFRITPLFVTVAALALLAPAQSKAQQPADPQSLVTQMVNNELASNDRSSWRYRLQSKEADGVQTYDVIQTPDGSVRKLLLTDGQQPVAARLAKVDAETDRFISDDAFRAKKRKHDQDDAQQAERMMKLLPTGFVYSFDGDPTGDVIKLKFSPNPEFHPSTREAKVFHAMEGNLEINAKQKRLVRLSGTLTEDVDFVGGIAHLKKGGTFMVVQSEIAGGHWMVTTLNVRMTGRAMFFHGIDVHENQVSTNFQAIAADLSLEDAARLLRGPVDAQAPVTKPE
jgi:hypothetical protein